MRGHFWEASYFSHARFHTGITVDMVRKYMDDETADHMKTFCEEHGLI